MVVNAMNEFAHVSGQDRIAAMNYSEAYADDIFSHHVECFWQLCSSQDHVVNPLELLLPTCTFNIVFTQNPCFIKDQGSAAWTLLQPGATFIGQASNCLSIKSVNPISIKGIRFKPFAFANIIKAPIYHLNDAFLPLTEIFDIDAPKASIIKAIISAKEETTQLDLINELLNDLIITEMYVDEQLRAQLNFIMERHGSLRISEILEEFTTSKVTLRKHFIDKVGLPPKKIAQIWRMNRVLQLREEFPRRNLTELCLNAGFYDQAHFCKDFKLLFGLPPKKFFSKNSNLIKIANHNISKRFSNQYDPRI